MPKPGETTCRRPGSRDDNQGGTQSRGLLKMMGTAIDLLHLLKRSLIRNIKLWGNSKPGLCDELQSGELRPEALSFRVLIPRKPVLRALQPIELHMLIGKSYRDGGGCR
jgi:hypothetical protein